MHEIYVPPPFDSDEPLDSIECAWVEALAELLIRDLRAKAAVVAPDPAVDDEVLELRRTRHA